MFGWISERKVDESEGFLESATVEELRARRVWRFLMVTWSTWIVNGVFLSLRGYPVAAAVCFVDALVHLFILVFLWKHTNYRRIMNLNLMASGIGLFSVSLSAPPMVVTLLYCPVSIVVASQIVGVRAAFYWMIVTLILYVLFYMAVYGIHDTFYTTRLDSLLLTIGVAVCTFFCCQQGEAYYQVRIKNLIAISRDLQKKSEMLHHLATTDALTGLTNRFQFQETLEGTRSSTRRAEFGTDGTVPARYGRVQRDQRHAGPPGGRRHTR